MAEKQTNKDRLREITAGIEQGIKELFESDRYRSYLQTMSRFHSYSLNNIMLIHSQMPNATHVAGFNRWKDQFGRHVKKGAKSIQIIAPTPFKKKVEEVKLDPDTKAPMLDKDGNAIMEEKEIKIPMFKVVSVFDVSQTEGKPLPELASELSGNVKQYDVFVEALRRSASVPIDFKPISPDTDGFFSLSGQSITIREGMSEVQTVSAIIHEIAHSKLHNTDAPIPADAKTYQEVELFDQPALFSNGRIKQEEIPDGLFRYDLRGSDYDPGEPIQVEENVLVNHAGTVLTLKPLELGDNGFLRLTEESGLNFVGGEISAQQFLQENRKDRRTEEVEAESISYAVCQYYGIETGANSFGYIATWSKDKELKELKESLETINRTSSELITDIDRNFAEICKERGITQEKEPIEQEPATAQERLYIVDDKYLHIQRSDEGFDYTLYDKASKQEIDGGQLDSDLPLIMDAALEICKLHEIGNDAPIRLADISILDELQAAEVKAWEDDHVTNIETAAEKAETSDVSDTSADMRPDSPEQNLDEPMPDPTISVKAMQSYGYTDEEMLPLSKDRALELAERDVTVYLLYGDNTEAMALDDREIIEHDGLFGITREDWDAIKADIPLRDVEKRFMQNPEDGILIYQLKETAPRELFFAGSDELKDAPDADNYKAVYTQPLYDGGSKGEVLEQAYAQFNNQRPVDFTGHSLSVSDIVAIKRGPDVSYHYCDTFGFKELEQFKPENYLKAAEMAMEDDYGMIDGIINNGPKQPTVAELEAQVKAGQSISLLDLANAVKEEKKPSVLEKLKNLSQQEYTRNAPKHSAEREL